MIRCDTNAQRTGAAIDMNGVAAVSSWSAPASACWRSAAVGGRTGGVEQFVRFRHADQVRSTAELP